MAAALIHWAVTSPVLASSFSLVLLLQAKKEYSLGPRSPALFDFLGVQVVGVATLLLEGVDSTGVQVWSALWAAVHDLLKVVFLEKQSKEWILAGTIQG